MGTVWVSVWRLLVKGSPLLAVLSLSAREGHRDVPPSGFSLFCWFPSVSRFLTGVFRVSAPHPQHSPLDASERIRQHPGSESLLCAPLSPELWRPLCALGPSHSLRPCLSPHCCAHPERWGPEARPGSLSRPQHKQACARRHADLDLVPCLRVITGMGAGPFQLSPGSEAPPGAGLSTAAVTMTQSPESL